MSTNTSGPLPTAVLDPAFQLQRIFAVTHTVFHNNICQIQICQPLILNMKPLIMTATTLTLPFKCKEFVVFDTSYHNKLGYVHIYRPLTLNVKLSTMIELTLTLPFSYKEYCCGSHRVS